MECIGTACVGTTTYGDSRLDAFDLEENGGNQQVSKLQISSLSPPAWATGLIRGVNPLASTNMPIETTMRRPFARQR